MKVEWKIEEGVGDEGGGGHEGHHGVDLVREAQTGKTLTGERRTSGRFEGIVHVEPG